MLTTESSSNELRILFDMQACQTAGSAFRGVGVYSSSLLETVGFMAKPREVYALVSSDLTHDYKPENINPANILIAGKLPNWHSSRSYSGGDQDKLDGIALSGLCQSIKPDVIHVSHVFEGFGDRVGVFDPLSRTPEQVVSATLYDLIPLLFQEEYFENKEFRRWYYLRVSWLRQADLLLAISESSRQDAIRLLGIEPWKIVTIHGSASDHFQPPVNRQKTRENLRVKFSLREKIVLYTGGDDPRKNIKGAIRGFSKVDIKVRENTQLVIVCSMQPERKKMYLADALKQGLGVGDVLITGSVEEQDLIDFYGICDVFFFPSLYEGLGLPVLEAMACGAPVIGGDNSSIRELIVRKDALFNASSDAAIGERISQVLTDSAFADDLRDYGLKRASEFCWERTAELSLAAFDEAVTRKRNSCQQYAVNGCLPSKRLAVLSPLPPSRSGIADYNAQFLPFLTKYFEIDLYVDGCSVEDELLTSMFRIFDVKDFERVATAYDLILYEIGNSEFHAHMLPLLEKFPGVVDLHDAYLSGLFGYLDFNMGDTGSYVNAMLESHGPNARHYFAPVKGCPDPNAGSMVELPCTKSVLDRALGVISHSKFNLETALKYYPQGWRAPYRIIPQMVLLQQQVTEDELGVIKEELGFKPNDFVLTTFGHIAWVKWGDRLLEAFLGSSLRDNSRVYLIFAGQLAKDDFGYKLENAIKKSGLKKRIRITGYLSDEDYIKYLQISDLAIQLRTKSRGGTPKGVLDCLAHGVPVIVNNDASYTDYPDDVVIKLEADPEVVSITQKIEGLFLHQQHLSQYSQRGLEYVEKNHNPSQCAASYAAVLHEFSARDNISQGSAWVDRMAPFIGGTENPEGASKQATDWFKSIVKPIWKRRRLFVDVSYIAKLDSETGVARVVKETILALYTSMVPGFDPVAVELIDGRLYQATNWLNSKGILIPSENLHQSELPVEFKSDDVLLMLDASWERYDEFYPAFEQVRLAGASIVTVIYDLLPISLPKGCIVEGGREWFESWLQSAIKSSDELICISRTTADGVIEYVENHYPKKKSLKVGYWHLGSDFQSVTSTNINNEFVSKLKEEEYLLVVGTIEPRKSHALILDVFELLWKSNIGLKLVIAGKKGWLVDDLMTRIYTHPELGNRLVFIENPNDSEIAVLYKYATGLIFLSRGEGFGLPIIEAADYGVPIICSNIPVFREIAGDYATYVDLDSPQSISNEIIKWYALKNTGELPDSSAIPKLDWKESSDCLLDVVFEQKWYWNNGEYLNEKNIY